MFGLVASLATNWRRAAVVIAVWGVVGAAVVVTAPPLSDVTTNEQENFLPDGSESLRVLQLVREKFPRGQGIPAIVVFHQPDGLSDSDLAAVARVDETLQSPDAPPGIQNVLALSTSSPMAANALLAPDGTTVTTIVTISGSPAEEEFREVIRWIRDQARAGTAAAGLTVAITGPAGIISDAVEVFASIDFRVTLFTVLFVLVLLLLIYRSPALALLPLAGVGWTLVIAQGVAATLAENAGLLLNGQVTALMSVLMFGAGTDFTLFIVARYREELRQQPDRWRAMQVALRRVGPAIASSAGTTIAAMLALLLATFGSFQTMGPVLALAMFLMLLSGLTFIPAMAVLLGRAAFWPGRMHVTGTEHSRIWSRVADFVTRRPVATFTATFVLLVAFAAGTPTITPNFSFIGGFPDDAESKIGAQIMDDAFGAGELAPTNVYLNADNVLTSLVDVDRVAEAIADIPGVTRVSGPTRPTGEAPAVEPAALQAAVANLPPGILRGGAPTGAPAARPPSNADPQMQAVIEAFMAAGRFISPDGSTARLDVVMGDDPYGIPAIERIDEVRATARSTVEGTSLADAEVLVGGPTALQTDAWASVNTDVRLVGPIVVVLIWFILLLLLRSLVAATYLIGSVLLSFLSALGISVVIFQNLMGHPGVGYQNAVFMFIFLAALGADYNILIMTRVREEIRARGLVER
ncbi:MAG: MMPL family transporter, partial [Chloroflexi bacterium]|nr:MMPL family transporter [Chloroflexota bacterium]